MLERCFLAVVATVSLSLLVRSHSQVSNSSQVSGTSWLSDAYLPKLVNHAAALVQPIPDHPAGTPVGPGKTTSRVTGPF